MSENEHLTAICRLTSGTHAAIGVVHRRELEYHIEALGRELSEAKDAAAFERGRRQAAYTQLAKAEARAGRWKVFARALGELNADLLSGPIDGSEAQATFQRKREQVWAAESDLYQHGDLPDTAGEERA